MRVFLDANVLFSAALPHTWMRVFLPTVLEKVRCVSSPYAVEEALRNLERKSPRHVGELGALVTRCELVSAVAPRDVKLPEKDAHILGAAIAGAATHLVTGDARHFGALFGRTVQGVKVVSPRMLADELVRLGLVKKINYLAAS